MNVTELKIMADGILGYAQRARRTLDELEKCAADLLRNLSHESCDIYNKDISCICSNGVCSTKEKNKSVLSNAGIKKESPDFDKFWSLYPGPRRVNKKVAAAKFSNFPAETVTAILEAIPNHVRYWKSENLSK